MQAIARTTNMPAALNVPALPPAPNFSAVPPVHVTAQGDLIKSDAPTLSTSPTSVSPTSASPTSPTSGGSSKLSTSTTQSSSDASLRPPRPVRAGEHVLIARLAPHTDFSSVVNMERGPDRREATFKLLTAHAQETQKPVIELLDKLRAERKVYTYESMFLPNAVLVDPVPEHAASVRQALEGVATINAVVKNSLWAVKTKANSRDDLLGDMMTAVGGGTAGTKSDPSNPVKVPGRGPAWGVEKVNADDLHKKRVTGKGITVGIVDTGLDSHHPAIEGHYRGSKRFSKKQEHEYNWLDPFNLTGAPFDDDGHGTHASGSIVGGTRDYTLGVAPGAKIIAAKGIRGDGYNDTVATLKATQFMLAPTNTQGRNPDPRKGADVVNNSWGNSINSLDETFRETWKGWIAAGIIPVASAGNEGPKPGTLGSPGGFAEGISVGATTPKDLVTDFSSIGPSKLSPGKFVPLIAAPGADIVSSTPGNGTDAMSGTSMAGPHVAGAVALLLSIKKNASLDEIKRALARTAVDIATEGPDINSGYGRIDVAAAAAYLKSGKAATDTLDV